MKAFIILTAMVLMFTITGCAQKSRYNPPLSEDEKIRRAILKMTPRDIIQIPPSEEDEKIRRAILKLKPQDIIRIPPSEEKSDGNKN